MTPVTTPMVKQITRGKKSFLPCDCKGCPHTAVWVTDAGFLYCQGHKYLDDAEAQLSTAVQAATC